MSDSIDPGRGGERSTATAGPRAVIHKKILEAAEARPDASFDELADAVSGASADLVERVIDEYGDPAEDVGQGEADDHQNGPAEPSPDTDETMSTTDGHTTDDADPDLEQLTDRQERVLRAVRDRPNATQEEIATQFDVSAATISQRVNAIDGFDWSRRREFVESLFGDDDAGFEGESQSDGPSSVADDPSSQSENRSGPDTVEPSPDATDPDSDASESETETADPDSDLAGTGFDGSEAGSDTTAPSSDASDPERDGHDWESADSEPRSNGEPRVGPGADTEAIDRLSEQVGDLAERVAALEGRIEGRSAAEVTFSDPDLVSKMVHACMESERVTEEEELRILRSVLRTADPGDS